LLFTNYQALRFSKIYTQAIFLMLD